MFLDRRSRVYKILNGNEGIVIVNLGRGNLYHAVTENKLTS